MWSDMNTFCRSQLPAPDWSVLPPSSQKFLHDLRLPSVHPFCQEGEGGGSLMMSSLFQQQEEIFHLSPTTTTTTIPPPMGRPSNIFEGDNEFENWITFVYLTVTPTAALIMNWVRLLSGLVAPLGILLLTLRERVALRERIVNYPFQPPNAIPPRKHQCHSEVRTIISTSFLSVMTVLTSMIVMVDSQYVFDFGPIYGITLFVLSVGLSLHACYLRNLVWTRPMIIGLCLVASYLTISLKDGTFHFGDAKPDDIPHSIQEGLYYHSGNDWIRNIVEHWPEDVRTYTFRTGATRWMPTGDARTGLPYVLNSIPSPVWNRVWLPTLPDNPKEVRHNNNNPYHREDMDDNDDERLEEYLALDIAFPSQGHDPSKPLYLVFHGLNGGSREGYVMDLANRRLQEGSTVVVMVARGLMDTPLQGWTVSERK